MKLVKITKEEIINRFLTKEEYDFEEVQDFTADLLRHIGVTVISWKDKFKATEGESNFTNTENGR